MPSRRALSLALSLGRRAGGAAFIAVIVLQVVAGLATGAQLLLGREILNGLDEGSAASTLQLGMLIAVIGGTTLVGAVARVQAQGRRELLTELIDREVTTTVVDAVAGMQLSDFDDPQRLDLIERVRLHSNLRALQVLNAVSTGTAAVAGAASLVVTLAVIAWPLALAIALVAVPLGLATAANGHAHYRFVREVSSAERRREYFVDVLTRRQHAAEIRALQMSGSLRRHYLSAQTEILQGLRGNIRGQVRRSSLAEALNALVLMAVLGGALAMRSAGLLTVASLAIAIIAIVQLKQAIDALGFQLGELQEASPFLDDLHHLVVIASCQPRSAPVAGDALRELRLDGVSVRVGASRHLALDNISLTFRAGEVVAVVGANGSGKTTLARLVAGLLRPDDGHVLRNGKLADINRPRTTLLAQDFGRYWLTLQQTLTPSDQPDASSNRPQQIMRATGMQHIAAQLDHGYETSLSPELGGAGLSGGQWQRVALARALLRESEMVILDEPTAALDEETEAQIVEQLRGLFFDRAVLIVTHRTAPLRLADRIITLDNGRLVASRPGPRQGAMADALGAGSTDQATEIAT